MIRSGFTVLIGLAAIIGSVPSSVRARQTLCIETCKQTTTACIRANCDGLRRKAERECKRTCRAQAACNGPRIRTLAYVVSECRTDAAGLLRGRQALMLRHGRCAPIEVMEFTPEQPVADPLGLCRILGQSRLGRQSPLGGVFQRIGVAPDGSAVAFEVSNELPVFPLFSVPDEDEGIFVVRADGSGLRRLAPASRAAPLQIAPNSSVPSGFGTAGEPLFAFSPDGQRVVFTDLGPGPGGEEALQIVTLNTRTGTRTQVTRLPPAPAPDPADSLSYAGTCCARFVDDETIGFVTYANVDGVGQGPRSFTVNSDGTNLRAAPDAVAIPGSRIDPTFEVVGRGNDLLTIALPGVPVRDPVTLFSGLREVFLIKGKRRILQLTAFRRNDTWAQFLDAKTGRAFFIASADPLGSNPTENCQIFSVGAFGGRMRQLTNFSHGEQGVGCTFVAAPATCGVRDVVQDPLSRTVLFYSSCDPFGSTPNGGQIYAMRPNGSRLGQLTHTRGMLIHDDGSVDVELPGPWAYSGHDR